MEFSSRGPKPEVMPVQKLISDYHLTTWPRGITIEDGSAAREIDKLNESHFDWPWAMLPR